MQLKKLVLSAATALLVSMPGSAQVVADLVAAPGIPAGNNFAPHTPAGTVIIGGNLWVGDEAQGLRHYIPVDPNNTDPINVGQLQFDMRNAPIWIQREGHRTMMACTYFQLVKAV